MSHSSKLGTRLVISVVGVVALVGQAGFGCAKVSTGQPTATGNHDAAGFFGTDAPGPLNQPGTVPPSDDAGSGTCTKAVCDPTGGHYCGVIGDKCGSTLDCGACTGNQTCEAGRCVGGASCAPLSCQPPNGRYCGKVGDGCGRDLDCGACPTGQLCTSGVCTVAGCVPLVCSAGSVRYCGTVGDGCGGTLVCGNCPAGSTCGGGVPGVCAATNCTPITCTPTGGGQYCGHIGNGCGGVLDCPVCPGGMACGTGAQAGVCPGVTTGTTCTGIQCNIAKCAGTAKTTVSGTIYDPAGVTPLYNVVAYIPNATLDPIPTGASCDRCNVTLSGQPIASALSDVDGKVHARKRSHGHQHPARDPGRKVAPAGDHPERHRLR